MDNPSTTNYISYATLVWGDLGFINFVDNTHLSQNQMAWLQWGRIKFLNQFHLITIISYSLIQALITENNPS